ncbi:MAG: ATP-binding cassette domain-containing protein [bacterium]|nr:ATP-binding cassette domain-containing protein [bacterium]
MIEFIEVEKSYGKKQVLKPINIKLEHSIYGLLGPNGAGKSTLMRIMVDLSKPTKGKVVFDGKEVHVLNEEYRARLGYLPQDTGFYGYMTGEEILRYFACLKGIKKEMQNECIKQALERVNLLEERKKKVGKYSGGMKRRLAIAVALMNDPSVIVLDEPTVGLDPKERVQFRELLKTMSKDRTIILSTHIVSDVDALADQIIMLKNGEIICNGKTEEIVNREEEKDKEVHSLEDVYMKYFKEV